MSAHKKEAAHLPKPALSEMPKDLIFASSLNSRGFYHDLLQSLKQDPSKCIILSKEDKSAIIQLRTKASKFGIKLLIAENKESYFFKIFKLSDVEIELMEEIESKSKSINELRALKLQCALEQELQTLSKYGFIKLSPQSNWYITDSGKDYLKSLLIED